MWRWCHWFPALVGSSNAEWLESAGKCLAVWNTNVLVSERQLRRRRSLLPMFISTARRQDGPADWLAGWLAEWVAGWISRDGHVRSELSHSPEPAGGSCWTGRERKHAIGVRRQIRNDDFYFQIPCPPLWGGEEWELVDWQHEMKTNNCIFQTAAAKSKCFSVQATARQLQSRTNRHVSAVSVQQVTHTRKQTAHTQIQTAINNLSNYDNCRKRLASPVINLVPSPPSSATADLTKKERKKALIYCLNGFQPPQRHRCGCETASLVLGRSLETTLQY